MDDLALAGRDVWSLDLRGYGLSWKPSPLRRPDGAEAPVVRTEDALRDLAAAVDYIVGEAGSNSIDLIGWSWGATIVAAAASRGQQPLRRIVLHAPQWLRDTPSAMVTPEALRQSYRNVDPAALQRRWFLGLREGPRAIVQQRGWDRAFLSALEAAGELRVPNGTIRDIADYWNAGRPFYDPSTISVPARVIVGDADVDTPPAQASALVARAPAGAFDLVIIPDATHFALLEPARDALFSAARQFLSQT
jgi:pimeloyl-ACP methyl ester carboxylesterase